MSAQINLPYSLRFDSMNADAVIGEKIKVVVSSLIVLNCR